MELNTPLMRFLASFAEDTVSSENINSCSTFNTEEESSEKRTSIENETTLKRKNFGLTEAPASKSIIVENQQFTENIRTLMTGACKALDKNKNSQFSEMVKVLSKKNSSDNDNQRSTCAKQTKNISRWKVDLKKCTLTKINNSKRNKLNSSKLTKKLTKTIYYVKRNPVNTSLAINAKVKGPNRDNKGSQMKTTNIVNAASMETTLASNGINTHMVVSEKNDSNMESSDILIENSLEDEQVINRNIQNQNISLNKQPEKTYQPMQNEIEINNSKVKVTEIGKNQNQSIIDDGKAEKTKNDTNLKKVDECVVSNYLLGNDAKKPKKPPVEKSLSTSENSKSKPEKKLKLYTAISIKKGGYKDIVFIEKEIDKKQVNDNLQQISEASSCDVCVNKNNNLSLYDSLCDTCDVVLSSNTSLQIHKIKHTNKTLNICETCAFIYSSDPSNVNFSFEYKRILMCFRCKLTKTEFIKGRTNKYLPKPFKCVCCLKSFKDYDEFQTHMDTHVQKYECGCCVAARTKKK